MFRLSTPTRYAVHTIILPAWLCMCLAGEGELDNVSARMVRTMVAEKLKRCSKSIKRYVKYAIDSYLLSEMPGSKMEAPPVTASGVHAHPLGLQPPTKGAGVGGGLAGGVLLFGGGGSH
jgi:hypothetical protein